VQATLSTAAATSLRLWAPFTIDKAFASGSVVRFAEAQADLARSLPATTRAAPYRWSFGDGATVVGHTAAHSYTRPGNYRLTVEGLDVGARRWYQFDAALVRIVPPDQVWRANLGYTALHLLDTVVAVLMGLLTAALGALAVFLVVGERRRRTSTQGRS
jgi:hypothetical protein